MLPNAKNKAGTQEMSTEWVNRWMPTRPDSGATQVPFAAANFISPRSKDQRTETERERERRTLDSSLCTGLKKHTNLNSNYTGMEKEPIFTANKFVSGQFRLLLHTATPFYRPRNSSSEKPRSLAQGHKERKESNQPSNPKPSWVPWPNAFTNYSLQSFADTPGC